MRKWKIVYIDDQQTNIECITDLLQDRFSVAGSTDPADYKQLLLLNPLGILIDVHMPSMNGYELYDLISADENYNSCPILFISGDNSFENKIESLQRGGVDFIDRDLNAEEFIARLENKVKLFVRNALKLQRGNLLMDFTAQKVFIGEKEITDLTFIEIKILGAIMRKYSGELSREELSAFIWGQEKVSVRALDVHISLLRSKLNGWNQLIKIRGERILIEDNKSVE